MELEIDRIAHSLSVAASEFEERGKEEKARQGEALREYQAARERADTGNAGKGAAPKGTQ